MSVRVVHRQKTNTPYINKLLTNPTYLQLVDVLSREEMTFPELHDLVRRDEDEMSADLNSLVQTGVAKRHFHHHKVTYTVDEPEVSQTARILYQLWLERVRTMQQA